MRFFWCLSILCVPAVTLAEELPVRVLAAGKKSEDGRLGKPVTLNDYFPFKPPASKEAWEARRKELREQLLVTLGLWPLPEKTPLNPVIHGAIDRDDYTVEKVFFASLPGHYVSGNLYRPKGKTGRHPAVLCPHGHWANGRFYDAGEKNAKAQMDKGAEKSMEGARFPLQARCAMLARMGCVVFHYDMVGNADSRQIGHTAGFTDAQAELWGQNFMGLQTWNSIRSLDFVAGLPDVDPQRIGVTGASGGGTQTFILCALDDRPAAAFPAVMVGTAMQGGCICENASYLRVGTGNVEIAALFAPKPLGMSGANDWTIDIETKGLPELKAIYKLYGAEENVMAKCHPEFEHNYNQVSRELMYNWFNKHLKLGQAEPVVEKPFKPIPPAELSVYNAEHPLPKDAVGAEGVRKWMAQQAEKQLAAIMPRDAATLAEFRRITGAALRTMVGDMAAREQLVLHQFPKDEKFGEYSVHRAIFGRKGERDRIPSLGLVSPKASRDIAIWIHPKGKESMFENGQVAPAVKALLDKNISVMCPDVLMVGEQRGEPRVVDKRFAGYTYGYNRPLLAEQVRDIVTAVSLAKNVLGSQRILLIGWGEMGPATVIAKAVAGDAVTRVAADMNQFRFDAIRTTDDPMMLPGAVRFGGLPAFAALAAPGEMYLHNHAGTSSGKLAKAAYDAAGATASLVRDPKKADSKAIVDWLTR